jgi:hypothetical protein
MRPTPTFSFVSCAAAPAQKQTDSSNPPNQPKIRITVSSTFIQAPMTQIGNGRGPDPFPAHEGVNVREETDDRGRTFSGTFRLVREH